MPTSMSGQPFTVIKAIYLYFLNNTGYLACFLVSTDRILSRDKFHVYITICICVMDARQDFNESVDPATL